MEDLGLTPQHHKKKKNLKRTIIISWVFPPSLASSIQTRFILRNHYFFFFQKSISCGKKRQNRSMILCSWVFNFLLPHHIGGSQLEVILPPIVAVFGDIFLAFWCWKLQGQSWGYSSDVPHCTPEQKTIQSKMLMLRVRAQVLGEYKRFKTWLFYSIKAVRTTLRWSVQEHSPPYWGCLRTKTIW